MFTWVESLDQSQAKLRGQKPVSTAGSTGLKNMEYTHSYCTQKPDLRGFRWVEHWIRGYSEYVRCLACQISSPANVINDKKVWQIV